MKKITDFIKTNQVPIKWTLLYFAFLWVILKFLFNFNMLSWHYWWKFFHANIHGFPGFIFCTIIYCAIPIYLATVIYAHKKQEFIVNIKIPYIDKMKALMDKIFAPKPSEQDAPIPEPEKPAEPEPIQFPDDLPFELRVPYMRAKQHLSFGGIVSVYNKQDNTDKSVPEKEQTQTSAESFPIPTDFDIGDFDTTNDANIPVFRDINFDEPTPKAQKTELQNNTTKYFDNKNINYEQYLNYIATDKYLIYEHSDGDFWIMDEDSWFASGQQIESPTIELKKIAIEKSLKPVLYLESKNVMDITDTIERFESNGIHVVTSLDELM